MKITDLRKEYTAGGARAAATVMWEDSGRQPQEISFGTEAPFGADLSCNPHAFLIACCMPALHHGEARIAIDAPVSPEVVEGLGAAMRWVIHWRYSGRRKPVAIEADEKTVSGRCSPARAGIFFSGGIDSLGTLRANRLRYPSGHPWSIRDGLLVCGLETEDLEKFGHVRRHLSGLMDAAGITLIPVFTNVRQLEADWMFWEHAFHDAVFAAIAHLFSGRLAVVSIASTYDIPNIRPYGTHPLLDSCYSSSDMLIRHDGLCLTRLQKTRLVAGWGGGVLDRIRVCNRSEGYEASGLNCGRCNKCVRTMLAMEALGVLGDSGAFPDIPLTRELVDRAIEIYDTTVCFFEELIEPLREKGRRDLAGVLDEKITVYRMRRERNSARAVLRDVLRSRLKRLDSRYLGGGLRRLIYGRREGRMRSGVRT